MFLAMYNKLILHDLMMMMMTSERGDSPRLQNLQWHMLLPVLDIATSMYRIEVYQHRVAGVRSTTHPSTHWQL